MQSAHQSLIVDALALMRAAIVHPFRFQAHEMHNQIRLCAADNIGLYLVDGFFIIKAVVGVLPDEPSGTFLFEQRSK